MRWASSNSRFVSPALLFNWSLSLTSSPSFLINLLLLLTCGFLSLCSPLPDVYWSTGSLRQTLPVRSLLGCLMEPWSLNDTGCRKCGPAALGFLRNFAWIQTKAKQRIPFLNEKELLCPCFGISPRALSYSRWTLNASHTLQHLWIHVRMWALVTHVVHRGTVEAQQSPRILIVPPSWKCVSCFSISWYFFPLVCCVGYACAFLLGHTVLHLRNLLNPPKTASC